MEIQKSDQSSGTKKEKKVLMTPHTGSYTISYHTMLKKMHHEEAKSIFGPHCFGGE